MLIILSDVKQGHFNLKWILEHDILGAYFKENNDIIYAKKNGANNSLQGATAKLHPLQGAVHIIKMHWLIILLNKSWFTTILHSHLIGVWFGCRSL